jgi:hypothetical protein
MPEVNDAQVISHSLCECLPIFITPFIHHLAPIRLTIYKKRQKMFARILLIIALQAWQLAECMLSG